MPLLLASLLPILPGGVLRSADPLLPYTLAVEVRGESHRVPATVLEEVERALRDALRARSCVRSLVNPEGGEPPRADILLQVTLESVVEETRHEASIAEIARPSSGPAPVGRVLSTFDVAGRVEILALPAGVSVRTRHLRTKAEREPLFPGEDSSAGARREAVDRLARDAKRVLCEGSRKKLQRQLEAIAR